ncbi:LrgB family protein [uncultured Anaerococcus sp.]|uniref:LrgB family protein n=1 Tax=uncultured Anaerococcus sp. TaxID=293428 RepID=UPI0026288383|nr:LrgB family protein [uncultured Anaerococcus sp.]
MAIIVIISTAIIIKLFNIYDPLAQGVGLGTVAHALGATKARDMGEVQEAMSGLSIAVAGIVTVGLMPLAILFTNLIK